MCNTKTHHIKTQKLFQIKKKLLKLMHLKPAFSVLIEKKMLLRTLLRCCREDFGI